MLRLTKCERDRVGVSQVKKYLEEQLMVKCLSSVPHMLATLDEDIECLEEQTSSIQSSLDELNPGSLKVKQFQTFALVLALSHDTNSPQHSSKFEEERFH